MKIEELIPSESIVFNLGGMYDAHGQRCAASKVGENLVYFVDIARGIDYFFECQLTVPAIRYAYLHNKNTHVQLNDYSQMMNLRSQLEKLALAAPSIS
jgi:hypothetical protein